MCLTFWHLTSFWQLDIFLTNWHLCDNLISFLTYGQWEMWANGYHGKYWRYRWGTFGDGAHGWWAMGHMVNVVMCLIMCNFLNTAGIFTKILLQIDFDVFYLNIQWYAHDGLFKYKKIEGFEILIGSNIGSMNLFQWARMELALYLCYQLDFLLDFFYWR